MSKQPEALRLADLLEINGLYDSSNELRRLHEQNELLIAANKDSMDHFNVLMVDHKKLHEVNVELLEALKQIIALPEDSHIHYKVARKALAKATGESA